MEIMEIILLVLVVFCTLIGWILTLYDDSIHKNYGLIGGFICVLCTFFIICGFIVYYDVTPKAIDVYRGKTILEITYRDSIPVDSVVVFKWNKYYDIKVEDFKFYKVIPNGIGSVTLIVPKGKKDTYIAKFAEGMKAEGVESTQEMLDNVEIIL